MNGDTALHIACQVENLEVVELIYKLDPALCMQPNYLGRSPFFIACMKQNLEITIITIQRYLKLQHHVMELYIKILQMAREKIKLKVFFAWLLIVG